MRCVPVLSIEQKSQIVIQQKAPSDARDSHSHVAFAKRGVIISQRAAGELKREYQMSPFLPRARHCIVLAQKQFRPAHIEFGMWHPWGRLR